MKRFVLVGYGRHAPKHLEVFRSLGVEFVASCNRSTAGCERARSEGKIPKTYQDISQMLESEKPDAVICSVGILEMFGAAKEIFPHRIPTLLEKPPGVSLQEFGALEKVQTEFKTPVLVGLNRRHYSVIRQAIEDAGGLGAITQVSVDWSEDPQHLLGRGLSPREVSRMIFGNSLHGIDLLTHLGGSILNPSIISQNRGEPFRWIMSLNGLSNRNVICSFQSNWDSPGRWRLSFCTKNRRYQFAPLESCSVTEKGIKDERQILPLSFDRDFKAGFYDQARDFLELVKNPEYPILNSLNSARAAMEIAEKLTNSLVTSN